MKKTTLSLLLIFSLFLVRTAFTETEMKQGDWKTYMLEDFEQCYNWEIINTPYFLSQWKYQNPVLSMVQGAPKDVSGSIYCLGAKITMDTIGDTKKYIIPIHKIEIPGMCKKISFWVNGRKRPVTIRIIVQDYFNVLHILEPQPLSLDFWGWKKIEVDNIDQKVIQLSSVEPDYHPMKFIGFVVENVFRRSFNEPFYVYIDQLEAVCRVDTLGNYDGSDIQDKW